MANPEHLDILKRGGEVWNRWREVNPEIQPDLSGANLSEMNLSGIDFSQTDLSRTIFSRANLVWADLRGANLMWAELNGAMLLRASLNRARIGFTSFGDVDLSMTTGLEEVLHYGPSTIGIDTMRLSSGKITESFLRGTGIPIKFIEYINALVTEPLDFYSCFISYSTRDADIAEHLYADLQFRGVSCWFAPKDLKIGEELRSTLDGVIRLRDKVLLVLSEHSIRSPWVKREVEQALDEEQRRERDGRKEYTILFPIRLDDSIFGVNEGWATDVRRRHIGDFRDWKDHDSYQKAFERLLRDLKADGAKVKEA